MKDSKPGIIQNISALGIADLGTAVIGGVFWLVIATLIDPEEYGQINYLLSKQISIKNKNQKANFLINTDQKIIDVEKEVRKIIKILEEKNE